jgi:hypothetical protein
MSSRPESEEEIREELKELGVDNEATGSPDILMSGAAVRAIALVLVVLLVAGAVLLVF